MAKPYFKSLNGLRAISVIIVVISHLAGKYNIFNYWNSHDFFRPLAGFIADGQMGVNVFFIISGFLITSLLLNEEEIFKQISLKDFYARRILRIFPAYYFLLLVYFVLQSFKIIHIDNRSWLTSLTYTKDFYRGDWYTAHAWSLSIEEQFYLLWPFVFIASKKFRSLMLVSVIFCVPLIRIIIHFHEIPWIMGGSSLFTRGDAIATGCLLAINKERISNVFQNKKWLGLWSFLILFAWTGTYLILDAHKIRMGLVYGWLGVGDGIVANMLISVIMMSMVYGPQNMFQILLNTKVLNWFGKLSYSIYLWQQFFINDTNAWYNTYPFNIFYIFVAAGFSFYFIEMPFLRMKSRFELKSLPSNKISYFQKSNG